MEALIVEDERVAVNCLVRMLDQFPDVNVVGVTRSVKDTVDWLASAPRMPDIIFMDCELGDGNCFELFRKVKISSNVIMTTAYNKYAILAFEVGCVDYLLKPIDPMRLHCSIERCRANRNVVDAEMLISAFNRVAAIGGAENISRYKKRFVVRLGEQFIPVNTADILYIYAEDKANYIVTGDSVRYMVNEPLDVIADEISPFEFFRISRCCIVSVSAIRSLERLKGGRLRIVTDFEPYCELVVARSRVSDFLNWFS